MSSARSSFLTAFAEIKPLSLMKKIFFFDLKFVRHDQNAPSESHLWRILAGDKVFYAYSHQFADAKVLKSLVAGDGVYIGAHQLADGSYWLHWLVSAEKGALQPNSVESGYPYAMLKLISSIAVLGLSALGYFMLPNVWVMLLLLVIFCFGCWWCMASLHAVSVSTSRRMRRLLQGFEQVFNGDVSRCHSTANLLPASWDGKASLPNDEPDNDFDRLQASDFAVSDRVTLCCVRGEATRLTARRDFTGSGRSQREFIDYQFTCNATRFSFHSGYNTLTEDLDPLFFRQHPFFLAANDPVTLVVNQQDGAVVGVCNERDGSAYLKLGGLTLSFQQLKLMYKLILGCCLFPLVLTVFFIAHDWWQQGGMPDKWDWLDAAEMLYAFGLMSMLFFCGLMLLLEVVSRLVRKNSLSTVSLAFARQMLMLFKRRCGKKAYIQEVA